MTRTEIKAYNEALTDMAIHFAKLADEQQREIIRIIGQIKTIENGNFPANRKERDITKLRRKELRAFDRKIGYMEASQECAKLRK